jgi:hypothetical protein
MTYEGSTASGARSGRTGATGVMDQGTGSGTGTGTGTGTGSGVGTGRSGTTGTGNVGSRTTGATTGGVSEGFRGLNLTGSSGVCSSSLSLEPFYRYTCTASGCCCIAVNGRYADSHAIYAAVLCF